MKSEILELSVIVPIARIYGKSKNLENWLLQLPKEDVEVILVHDIQDELTASLISGIITGLDNPKVHLIEGKYNSPGYARNAGLQLANANWTWFVDSDDLPNIKAGLDSIKNTELGVEAIVGNYNIDRQGNTYPVLTSLANQPVLSVAYNPGLWRIIFRSKAINGRKFKNYRMGEDQLFILEWSFYIRQIYFSEKIFYTYFQNVVGQLTADPTAINEISYAIEDTWKLFAVSNRTEKYFAAIMLIRQTLTLLKNGSFVYCLRVTLRELIKKPRLVPSNSYFLSKALFFVLIMKSRDRK